MVCVQLLGQFENTGPPPAEKEKISSLPTVHVSQEQAGQRRSSSTHGLAHAYYYLILMVLSFLLYVRASPHSVLMAPL